MALGTGQVDWPAVLRAAMKAGGALYYLEDESADPWGHIPQSVEYLSGRAQAVSAGVRRAHALPIGPEREGGHDAVVLSMDRVRRTSR